MKTLFFPLILLLSFLWSGDTNQPIQLTDDEYASLPDSLRRMPEYAVTGIDLMDDELEVTLFASEPMMTNPTNMDIDDKGRVWICEAFNYRNKLNPRNPYNKKGDRILIMEDTDGDGKADKSKVFYQGEDINAALGIAVLENKVIVSCSPKVFVFTDEDGDDIPDKRLCLKEFKANSTTTACTLLLLAPTESYISTTETPTAKAWFSEVIWTARTSKS